MVGPIVLLIFGKLTMLQAQRLTPPAPSADWRSRISRRTLMMSSIAFRQENDGELHYLLEFDPSSTEVNRSSAVSWA